MDALPSYPQLTPDDRYWRVDWFGECAYPAGVRRFAQPSIRVVLSPLRCDPSDQTALLSSESTDYHRQREAWPPVAMLPLLAIGDIWHEGRHFASPDYQVESFQRLHISPETTAFVKAGLAIDEHFLLPLGRHPWHRNHTQSYCVAVSMDDGCRLLVPCAELIRFYFGSSSNLLQRLFTAPLASERLWTTKRFNPKNKHLHLVLARGLSGASASDIGRVAESSFAWRAAAGIYASCQKASVQRHPVYPYTGFPFEGTTDLAASGIWLSFGEQENATFLVYRLRSCSHPFPFRSLSYESADRKVKFDKGVGTGSEAKKYSRESAKVDGKVQDADAGSNKAQRAHSFRGQHRFPDLARKQVWREKIEAIPKADVLLRRSDGTMEQVAFGEGDGSSDAVGLDVAHVADDHPDSEQNASLPWFVNVGLRAIAASPELAPPGTRLEVICPLDRNVPIFGLPMLVDEEGEIAEQLLFSASDGGVRQRRACFVEVTKDELAPHYLVIVEGETRSSPPKVMVVTKPVTNDTVLSLLRGMAPDVSEPQSPS